VLPPPSQDPQGAASELSRRLRERRGEIEAAIVARAYGVEDPTEASDPAYVAGLRAAVGAALGYGLAAAERPDAPPEPIPASLAAQARSAARNGIALETVLRRYFGGYMLLGDFLIAAAQRGAELQRAWRALAACFDRLLEAVAQEYRAEASGRAQSSEQRRAGRVRRLLAGELLESAELDYELHSNHLGAVVAGPGAKGAIRELAAGLDRQLLLVQGEAGTIWAWLGGRGKLAAAEALRRAHAAFAPELTLALGEAGEGIGGWRATHRQAKAAIPIALQGAPRLVCYADVALLAAALGDEVLAGSLRDAYLAPLEAERDGGAALRETLCAYFAAGRHISSTAAALGVSRRTVTNRLAVVEERVGKPLDASAAELETALRLSRLEVGAGSNREPG
jgi:DNA-binding PucR family transcriptional regulator